MILSIIWFFIKFALLGGFILFFGLSIISLILYNVGIPISKIGYKSELVYTALLYPIFIYLNGFLGAYYFELVNHYHLEHHIEQKWGLILFSILFLGIWLKFTLQELDRQVRLINEKMDPNQEIQIRRYTGVFNKDLLYHYVINCSLKMSFFSSIGFISFLIFPSLCASLYGNIPSIIAGWFK